MPPFRNFRFLVPGSRCQEPGEDLCGKASKPLDRIALETTGGESTHKLVVFLPAALLHSVRSHPPVFGRG